MGKNIKRVLIVFVLILSVFPGLSAQTAVDFYRRGKNAQNSGDWYSAAEQYQEALRINPSFFDALYSLAQCFYELEEYDRALTYVLEAGKLRSNSQDVQTLHGFILIGLGQLEEASAVFSSVLTSWPNNINARFGLGELDVAAGRISAAENQYMQALYRSPENRRALLSLAMICQEEGKNEAAAGFIEQALKYYGDNAQTLYIAGVFEMNRKNYGLADKYLRAALTVDSGYIDALDALASVLYYSARYQEMNSVADTLIGKDRGKTKFWYQKVLALSKLNRIDEAVSAASSGLKSGQDDEILRSFAEDLILAAFPVEDSRRAGWASARFKNAASFERHNMPGRAILEYRRGLKLNPYDTAARSAYASLLLAGGYHTRYLEEMVFIQSLGDTSTKVSDAVENYGNLLSQSVSSRWNIDSLYVDKGHISIGLYFFGSSENLIHPGAEETTASALADVLSFYRRFDIYTDKTPVSGYAEAFRKSRENGDDYFALVTLDENNTDISVKMEVFLSRTGAPAAVFSVFRTGNGRFSSALRRLADTAAASFPVYGTVIQRDQNNLVIDLGKADGIAAGARFAVIPSGALSFITDGLGVDFTEESVLGYVDITAVDSDVSEGTFSRKGFFDRMNPGDVAVLLPPEPEPEAGTAEPAAGNTGTGTEPAASQTVISGDSPWEPGLFSILRSIR